MPRGGRRKGTPGKGYSNRTDMMVDYAPDETGGAAAGGMEAGPPAVTPEDSPMLFDDTANPQEPVTAGLPIGAGPGPQRDTRLQETANLKKYLPLIGLYLDQPDTPDSVRVLFRYIRGA